MGGYKSLYNGTEYIGFYPGTTGHPYFEWDTLRPGMIQYDGIRYQHIGLKYDLVSNEVVLKGKQNLMISLVPQKIDFFSIEGHVFVPAGQDSTTQLPPTGFFEVLYGGRATVLAKRTKQVQRGARVEDPYIFRQYDSYFVKANGAYHPVDSEKDLLLVFNDQQEALKSYLRRNGINFKKDKETSIIRTASYYDQLKN
jgi:hypothetical protein